MDKRIPSRGKVKQSTESDRMNFVSLYGILEHLATNSAMYKSNHPFKTMHDYSSLESLIKWNRKNVLY